MELVWNSTNLASRAVILYLRLAGLPLQLLDFLLDILMTNNASHEYLSLFRDEVLEILCISLWLRTLRNLLCDQNVQELFPFSYWLYGIQIFQILKCQEPTENTDVDEISEE